MGSPGAASSKTPRWAQQGLADLFGGPANALNAAGGLGMGGFGDVLAGFTNAPSQSLFGPYAGMTGPVGQFSDAMAQMGGPLSMNAIGQASGLFPAANALAFPGMQSSGGLNAMAPGFLQAAAPFLGNAMNYGSMDPEKIMSMFGIAGGGGRTAASPFSGQVAPAALGQLGSMDPNGDIFNRAMGLLRPQVRSGFSDRGLGGSGAAIKGESDAAQQLADQMAQQSAQNKIGLLGAAGQGEQANASMTNALANWQLGLGQQGASLFNTLMQGNLQGAQAPGQMFNTFQQGTGAGINNIIQGLTGMGGLGLQPLQAFGAGLQGMGQLSSPLSALYSAVRAPEMQLLQAAAGSTPLQQGHAPLSILGIPKG